MGDYLMRFAAVASALIGLSACAPTITPHDALNRPEGLQKTVRAKVTPWFTSTGTPRVSYNIGSGPVTLTASNASGLWAAGMPGSQALSEGTPVTVEWSVSYTPLLLPAPGTVTKQQTFTVGPPPPLIVEPDRICVQEGDSIGVEVNLPTQGTAAVSLSVLPTNLANLQTNNLTVTTPPGDTVDLTGRNVGNGNLTATASGFGSAEVPVRVIWTRVAPDLVLPSNGDTGVYAYNEPNANATGVSVALEWQEVPGAYGGNRKYEVSWRENGGVWNNAHIGSESLSLSFPPGTEVDWRVRASFEPCPPNVPPGSGPVVVNPVDGPWSEVWSFSVWAAPGA